MNKRSPYEEQIAKQLNEVSLPDENFAWADMKRRLEEEDDDDRIIPFWLSGCLLWTLFGVVVIGLGWWMFRPEKRFERKKAELPKISASQEERHNNSSQKVVSQQDSTIFFESRLKQQDDTIQNHRKEIVGRINRKKNPGDSMTNKKSNKQGNRDEKKNGSGRVKHNVRPSDNKNLVSKIKRDDNDKPGPLQYHVGADSSEATSNQNVAVTKADFEKNKKDSSSQNTQSKKVNVDDSNSPSLSFAAGFSLHQQLPVNDQKLVPYNSEGRKGTLADYVPSVYLRMYKRNNWFIQAEFRYGAPQYTKEFLYQQITDTAQNGGITHSSSLKKTYYHQLPLTFNYFVSKNLSIGAGVVWNRFVSAISSQDVVKHNNITGIDSVISKGTILTSEITDTGYVFARSWSQALFVAEYKWKRFSVGAKYAIGLEPYIKFELQPGVTQQEKNSSVDIFLRYELWRSKKK